MSVLENTVQDIMKCSLWFKTACGHERFTVSLRLCRNVCSLKWQKVYLWRLNNLIPLVSCTSKTEFPLWIIKSRTVALNWLIDSVFLILLLSLFQVLIQHGKKTSETLWFLQELALFYSGLLTESDTLLHWQHSGII